MGKYTQAIKIVLQISNMSTCALVHCKRRHEIMHVTSFNWWGRGVGTGAGGGGGGCGKPCIYKPIRRQGGMRKEINLDFLNSWMQSYSRVGEPPLYCHPDVLDSTKTSRPFPPLSYIQYSTLYVASSNWNRNALTVYCTLATVHSSKSS
jgi:hypothetical protein